MDDDPEASLIRKVLVESGLLQKLVYPLVASILGVAGGAASHSMRDAGDSVTIQELRNELKDFKKKYYERQQENRTRADSEHLDLERERRHSERYLERRLTRIESKLGMEAPPTPVERVE